MQVSSMSPGQLPAAIMEPILTDAASRAGLDVEQMVVVRAEAVTWPNPGLGCPEPGMAYPQVLVDGYWVVVEASGMEYDYRGRRAGEFRLCELPKPQRQQPVEGGADS
jgi:hypothetical protein